MREAVYALAIAMFAITVWGETMKANADSVKEKGFETTYSLFYLAKHTDRGIMVIHSALFYKDIKLNKCNRLGGNQE